MLRVGHGNPFVLVRGNNPLSLFPLFSFCLLYLMFRSLAFAPASLTTTVMATTAFRCPSYYGCSISSQWLDEIVSAKIAEIATNASVSPDSGCLLSDMGDFLVRASASLARLAEGVVHGPHIDVYVEKRIKEMEQEHDFSELGALDYIDEKHSSLK